MALCLRCSKSCASSGEIGELLGLTSSNNSKVIGLDREKSIVDVITKDKRQDGFSLTPSEGIDFCPSNANRLKSPPLLELLEQERNSRVELLTYEVTLVLNAVRPSDCRTFTFFDRPAGAAIQFVQCYGTTNFLSTA